MKFTKPKVSSNKRKYLAALVVVSITILVVLRSLNYSPKEKFLVMYTIIDLQKILDSDYRLKFIMLR